jgi:hypothetical protein
LVFGLCPLSGILENKRIEYFGNWISFRLQMREWETIYSGRSVRSANLNHWTRLALSKGPNTVGVSLPSPEDGNRYNLGNVVLFCIF